MLLPVSLVLFPISTHAPRTGSDKYNERHAIDFTISTHAPRTGSDIIPNT